MLGAFFGRRVAAVDTYPELEPHLARADPLVRYAVFLEDVVGRYRASPDLRAAEPRLWTLLRAEDASMRRDHDDAWRAGAEILTEAREGSNR